VRDLYGQRLIAEQVLTADDLAAVITEEHNVLERAYDNRSSGSSASSPARLQYDLFSPVKTSVTRETLDTIANAVCGVPEDFNIHAKVKAEVEKRRSQFDAGTVQWGMAEALAFGALILEGHSVRITGQDTGRGTFNHRQAVQADIVNDRRLVPLNRLASTTKKLHIFDSFLSEYAVLGFEYGYSTIAKNDLTIWEAQFGDFANGAQIVIDQFISSAEEKWGQRSNITMLLPHGYDGQGPEHSSARLERFLQLCAQDNMIVCNFTSPANYFHAIRRQVLADWRKPLVIMTPKGYLRVFTSSVEELVKGAYQEVINDASIVDPSAVQRVVISTGKVHFELLKKREQLKQEGNVALVRLEQVYPFHAERMRSVLNSYPSATEVVWCQEEPQNMGAWFYVEWALRAQLRMGQRLNYAGRSAAASPATGSAKVHEREQDALLSAAFSSLA
jgi:2-oxoglutarate dehydrogenase E1 component